MGRLVGRLATVVAADDLAEVTGGMSLHVWLQHTARCTHGEVRVAQRAELDGLVAAAMVVHRDGEPDALVADVWAWVDAAFDQLEVQRRALTRGHGTALADRLLALCEADLAGRTRHDSHGDADADGAGQRPARPLVIATIDLEVAAGPHPHPGLVAAHAGGRLHAGDLGTLQRLVDARGADLRTVVLDDGGQAVGIGTRSQIPPRALREAAWARDLAVRDPDGSTPIRRADLDHIIPSPDGPTDVDNLQPLGRRWHNHKTSKRWTVHRARDGTTTWRHRRHGWTIRLGPARRDLTDVPDPGPPRLPLDLRDDLDPPEPAPTAS